MAEPATSPPGPEVWPLVAGVWFLALCLLIIAGLVAGFPDRLGALVVLCVLGIVSWLLREPDVRPEIQISFTSIVLVAAAGIVGPVGAGIVGAVSTLAQRGPPSPRIVRVFNIGLLTLLGVLGGLSFVAAGGSLESGVDMPRAHVVWRLGVPLLVVICVQMVVNAGVVALLMTRLGRGRFGDRFVALVRVSGMAYLGYGVLGLLFVALWVPAGLGWLSALLLAAPLLVSHWALVQYGAVERAHEQSIRVLAAARELADPAAGERGERVAQVGRLLGEELGVGLRVLEQVETLAPIYDIGRLSVAPDLAAGPTAADRPGGPLPLRAIAGADLLNGLTWLDDVRPVLEHLEDRADGAGRHGVPGEETPVAARIVAVAAAYVEAAALDPASAHAVVRADAGSRFDPRVVDALVPVLARLDGHRP